MLKLNQTGANLFTILDNYGCEVLASKEELAELCQQIDNKVENGLSQKKKDTYKDTHIVILENGYNNDERVQMELSDSAYRLLRYLYEEDWFNSYTSLTEVDEKDFERFV